MSLSYRYHDVGIFRRKDLDEWTFGVMFLLHLYDGILKTFKEEMQLEQSTVKVHQNIRKNSI